MARVIVLGSSNTDMTVRLPALPAPGQTLLGGAFLTSPGGKGANQAVAARRAGAEVVFITAVGDDDMGRRALDLYGHEGIQVDHARVISGASSGVALIFVGQGGENMIGVAPGANQDLTSEDVDRLPDSLFSPGDALLAGLEIPIRTAIRAMRRGKSAGMTVLLNPAPAPVLSRDEARELLASADILTPNRGEALSLAEIDGTDPIDWDRCAARLLAMGPKAVVITLGAEGCLVVDASRTLKIPAPRVEAVDTVGAGDAFNGALAVALAEGRPLREAASWASAAAALAVTRPGAQSALPFRKDIDALVAGGQP